MNLLKKVFAASVLASSFCLSGTVFAEKSQDTLETVSYVDIERYMGKWYELASFPQPFSTGCTATTAEYSLNTEGTVKVVNSCYLGSPEGEFLSLTGEAYVADTETNSKLKVAFYKPYYGDYWIVDLDENYEYAMVGNPTRDSLWFLSRTPEVSTDTFDYLKFKAASLGFDVSKLNVTPQVSAL